PVGIALRLLVPCVVAVLLTLVLYLYLAKTFVGRAIKAVSQDSLALRLMGADPVKVKDVAFGIAIATASLAGALLIMIGPVEPSMNREYIGRVFAVAVLGGMGRIGGTFLAAGILGGYTGYVNFGTAAFFALGAYTSVVLIKGFAAPLPVLLAAGAAVAGLLGLGIGYLTLRLRGVFFSIATLALAVVLQTMVINW